MISRWEWVVEQIVGRLWFWSAAYGMLAVGTALLAVWLTPLIPERVSAEIGADAVEDILTILASSMLTVATFSLSTMVATFAATTSMATPRAAQLLIEDRTAQNAIATFIGAFLYSLVGIIALRTGFYGSSGRLVLLGVTILVVLAVVLTLFRWVDYLSQLGRLGEIVDKLEGVAFGTLRAQFIEPHLGGVGPVPIPTDASAVRSEKIGYVQHLDMEALERLAGAVEGRIHVVCRPGAFVDRHTPLAWTTPPLDEDRRERLLGAFLIGPSRSFKQDPRFGLIVLSEVASRALSPGVNDPGTAIDVMARAVRILSGAFEASRSRKPPRFRHIHAPAISIGDLLEDVFTPIARHGADNPEVGVRLQKSLRSLACLEDGAYREHAERMSALALRLALAASLLEEEVAKLTTLAAEVAERATADQGIERDRPSNEPEPPR